MGLVIQSWGTDFQIPTTLLVLSRHNGLYKQHSPSSSNFNSYSKETNSDNYFRRVTVYDLNEKWSIPWNQRRQTFSTLPTHSRVKISFHCGPYKLFSLTSVATVEKTNLRIRVYLMRVLWS